MGDVNRQADHLTERRILVDGRPAVYSVGGEGRPLIFLHGWGLAHRAYRRALKRLVQRGHHVFAPALPGFGGTADLPDDDLSLAGYARWVDRFAAAVGVSEPVTLVGHSFGGGVAIRTGHDCPRLVGRLVVVNSIGGSAWTQRGDMIRALRERPIWDWGMHFGNDVLPRRQLTRVLPVIVQDAVPNLIRNPRAIVRVANLARTADLRAELEELKRRRVPVVVLWGDRDTVIPAVATDALRNALGEPTTVTVAGNHTWLLADPDGFGEVMTNVIDLDVAEGRVVDLNDEVPDAGGRSTPA